MKIYTNLDTTPPLGAGDKDYIVRDVRGEYKVIKRVCVLKIEEHTVASTYAQSDATLIAQALTEQEGI